MYSRRLLYVACTRAQGLLYLSHTASRNVAGNKMDRKVSPFVSMVQWDDPVSTLVFYIEKLGEG